MLPDKIKNYYEENLTEFADIVGERIVLKNQVIIKVDPEFTDKEVAKHLNKFGFSNKKTRCEKRKINKPKFKIREDQVIRCCWDKSLCLIINNRHFYNALIAESGGGGTRMEGESGGGGTRMEGESGGGGTRMEGEASLNELIYDSHGADLLFSGRQQRPKNCDRLLAETDCKIKKHYENSSKCNRTINVGIIDLGIYKDSHAEKIETIIHNYSHTHNAEVLTFDYNTLQSFTYANSFSVSCQIARGIRERMDILNISLGYYGYFANPTIEEYIRKAARSGIMIVGSAGNYSRFNDQEFHWPSNFSCNRRNFIAVGSMRKRLRDMRFKLTEQLIYFTSGNLVQPNKVANFSNYGICTVDCYDVGTFDYDMLADDSSTPRNFGSSYSTAVVSAKVALLFFKKGKTIFTRPEGFDKDKILCYLANENIIPRY